jgi:hypothetical protein
MNISLPAYFCDLEQMASSSGAMSTPKLAVLVLALTLLETGTEAAATVTAIEERAELTMWTIAVFQAVRLVLTETITPAMARPILAHSIPAKAVRIRIVLTVHETDAAVSTATGTGCFSSAFCQGGSRKCGSQGYTRYSAGHAAKRGTPSNLFVSQRFGDIFKPVCHRHLLLS